MRTAGLVLCATLLPVGVAFGQSPVGPVGSATVSGVEIPYRCTPVPEGAQRFYVEASFANSDIVRAPDLPEYTTPLPGLVAGGAGTSTGSGTGDPIGDFTFQAHWSGYQPGFVIAANGDVFSTADGDLYADELFTGDSATAPPNLTMEGAFTFTGGTGRYRNAAGSASATAQQLGDGVHTAVVACGWIEDISEP